MAYTASTSLALGSGKAGLTDLRATLYDSTNTVVTSGISSTFYDWGQGNYLWTYSSFPASFRGGAKIYSNATPATTLAIVAINPEDLEYIDTLITGVTVSNISAVASGMFDLPSAIDGYTLRQLLKLIGAALLGKTEGAGTTTVEFTSINGTDPRITAYIDTESDRVVVDLTP